MPVVSPTPQGARLPLQQAARLAGSHPGLAPPLSPRRDQDRASERRSDVWHHQSQPAACRLGTGQAPQALAALRNGVLNAIRHRGWKNVAAALRHFEASAVEALALRGVGLS